MVCRIKTYLVYTLLMGAVGCAGKTPFRVQGDPLDSANFASAVDTTSPKIEVAKPSIDDPVTLGMACTATQTATGALIEVWIQVDMAEDVFLHASDPQHPEFKHLVADLALPPGWQPQGDWETSAASLEAGHSVFRDRVLMHRKVLVPAPKTKIPSSIAASVSYQACTDSMCWAPLRAELTAPIPSL